MELTFRIAKLLEYAACLADLEANTNPFAAVVRAHLQALATRNDPATRRTGKLQIVKALYRGNFSKEDVRRLFGLIDWIMTLPEDLEEAFRIDVYQFEEEHNVAYMSSIERYGFKKGQVEGLEKGREEGLLEAVTVLLNDKFGRAARPLLKKASAITDPNELHKLLRFLNKATSVDEVRAYLN